MKSKTFLTFACMGLLLPAMAQERTAGGQISTQMNWSDLSTQITTLNAQVSDTNGQMNQLVECGKKGMLYAFGKAGADTDGCKPLASGGLSACYQRAGGYGVHVACNDSEVVTKVCTAGRDADCIAPGGSIMNTGKTTADEHKTGTTSPSQKAAYTVVTCCKIQ